MGGMIREPFGAPFLMRQAYGEALVELGRARQDVVVLSADVSNSDFSFMFEAAFPERFFNVGIAEPALVDVAVGLANSGFVPIANTFAFLFATRAVEMVRTHLCFGGANVKLAGAYAGLSDSFDGPTHHSITDLAILNPLVQLLHRPAVIRHQSHAYFQFLGRRLFAELRTGSVGFIVPSLLTTWFVPTATGALPSIMCHFALVLAIFLTRMVAFERKLAVEPDSPRVPQVT